MNEDGLHYDQITSLPLLDSFVKEVLRLYPPVPSLPRTFVLRLALIWKPRHLRFPLTSAKIDTVIPLQYPVLAVDGTSQIKEIVVRAGTTCYVGILGSNRNIATWGKDAHEFNPDRWLSPLPCTVDAAPIPSIFSHL